MSQIVHSLKLARSSALLSASQPESAPGESSELSAPISDVEPESTATAARRKSSSGEPKQVKRSYKTVDPIKRSQLIEMVHSQQKTIKEAANRLKINYSTAKHIIKSTKNDVTKQLDNDQQA